MSNCIVIPKASVGEDEDTVITLALVEKLQLLEWPPAVPICLSLQQILWHQSVQQVSRISAWTTPH